MVSFGIFLSFLTGFVTVNLISLKFSLIEKLGALFPDRHSFADFVDAVDGCRRYSAYKSLDFSGECLAHPIAFVPDDFPSERTCSGDSETGLFRFLRF